MGNNKKNMCVGFTETRGRGGGERELNVGYLSLGRKKKKNRNEYL